MPKTNTILALCLLGVSVQLKAHTLAQKFSNYTDNQGMARNRLAVNLGLNFTHRRTLTASGVEVNASRDEIRRPLADKVTPASGENASQQENLQTDAADVTFSQTWNRLTDTRVLIATSKDVSMLSQTAGLGVSQWFIAETLQVSVDGSHTWVDRRSEELLGEESDFVSPPTYFNATGFSLGIKHLTTPTTITQASARHVETNDRPPANTYSAGIKQFIRPTKSALHFTSTRAINRGRVTNATTYGEVSAWIFETAYWQELWRGALSQLGYRYYREDETTRVYKDELIRASDAVIIGINQDVKSRTFGVTATRYLTNAIDDAGTKVAATILEFAFAARF